MHCLATLRWYTLQSCTLYLGGTLKVGVTTLAASGLICHRPFVADVTVMLHSASSLSTPAPTIPHSTPYTASLLHVQLAGCNIRNVSLGSSEASLGHAGDCFKLCVAEPDCTFFLFTKAGECV
jgi:hypothetical protein